MSAVYDRIGVGYDEVRRPDSRLATLIAEALGDAHTVVNVGAGAGSYEPVSSRVVAVDPSAVMLAQHRGTSRVQGAAEDLPFPSDAFDAAMAVMTIHHWTDLRAGLAEMRRVSRCQVVFTWDKEHDEELWVVSEYLPEIRTLGHARFPSLGEVVEALGQGRSSSSPFPTTLWTGTCRRFGDGLRRTWMPGSEPRARRSRRFRITWWSPPCDGWRPIWCQGRGNEGTRISLIARPLTMGTGSS